MVGTNPNVSVYLGAVEFVKLSKDTLDFPGYYIAHITLLIYFANENMELTRVGDFTFTISYIQPMRF